MLAMRSMSVTEVHIAQSQINLHCPQLPNVFNLYYGRDSNIYMRDYEDHDPLSAINGCVQGCCMGPLVFGFATLPLYI